VRVLVDSSVWISHLQSPNAKLIQLLEVGEVVIHPFILGELASGNLRDRARLLGDLKKIPILNEVSFTEVLELIENQKLFGKGLGWVDCQLLATALVNEVKIFTKDLALQTAAKRLGVGCLK
jgi:predicted nucleic acid-binding protein